MGVKRKLAKNTIYNGVFYFVSMSVYFFLMPFIIRHIGTTQFAIYVLSLSLVNYFGLLELGVSTSLVKYVSEYYTKKERERLCQVISTTFFFYLALGFFISLCLLIISTSFTHYFNVPHALLSKFRLIVHILALATLFNWPLSTFRNVLAGLQRYDIISFTGICTSVASALGTVFVLYAGYGLVGLILLESSVSILALLTQVAISFYLLGRPLLSWKFVTRDTIQLLAAFSFFVFLIQVSHQISYKTDAIVLGLFLPVGIIAYYEAAHKIQGLPAKVFTIANSAVMPAASEISFDESRDRLKEVFLKGTKYAAAGVVSVTIPLLILTRPLLINWLGVEFKKATLATQVFLIFWLFSALSGITNTLLIGAGKVRFLSKTVVIRALLNLVLSIILVRLLGLIGVILGTVISELLVFPFVMKYVFKFLSISLSDFIKSVLLKTYFPVIFVVPFLIFLIYIYYPSNLILVAIYGFSSVLVYLSFYYGFSLDNVEKERISNLLLSPFTSAFSKLAFLRR